MNRIPLTIALMLGFAGPSLAQNTARADAPAVQAAAANADSPDQEVKCRSLSITGSLVKKVRVCKTVAEWRRLREAGSGKARTIVEHGRELQQSN